MRGRLVLKMCVAVNKYVSQRSTNSDGICHSWYVYVGCCSHKPFPRSVCVDICRFRGIGGPSNDMFGQGHYIMAITW